MQVHTTIRVFCSYAPEDEVWCKDLEKHVRLSLRQGLFDLWHQQLISPGSDKQQALTTHIQTAEVILLLISPDYLASDHCYAEMVRALERQQKENLPVVPILVRALDWEQAPFAYLSVLPTSLRPLASSDDKDGALAHVAAQIRHLVEKKLTNADDAPDEICPYKGLEPYREEDATFFFGREMYLQNLLQLLQNDVRFLLILGPNSSGKTSLVQAGLVPFLRQHGLPGITYPDFGMYIPRKPLLETWLALPIFGSASTAYEGLLKWRKAHPLPARPVLIIDALENLFHCADEMERADFVKQLAEVICRDVATLILVMRDDYYSDLAVYKDLISFLEKQTSNLPPLTPEMTRAIIEKPAQLASLKIEQSLVSTIADQTMSTQAEPRHRRLHRHSSVLPLLSYLLAQMFQRRQCGELTSQAYQELGGIAGSLTRWATDTYLALAPEQQSLARRIFTALMVPGDESSGLLAHAQSTFLRTLSRDEQEFPTIQEVAEHFARAHLLTLQYDTKQQDTRVSLIHDALLYEWSLFQDWLSEDYLYLVWHHAFQKRVEDWEFLRVHAPKESAEEKLLRKGELATAQDWYQQHGAGWTKQECMFLEVSQQYLTHQQDQQGAYQQAQQEKQNLFAQNLAAQALLLQEQQPQHIELSILLAAEAFKRSPSFEARKALQKGLQLLPQTLQYIQRTTSYTRLAVSNDGSHILAAGERGLVWIQHADDEEEARFQPFPEFRQVHDLTLNADGTKAVLLNGHVQLPEVWIVDLTRQQSPQRLPHNERVVQIMCQHNEAITATESGHIQCWQLANATHQRCFDHPDFTAMSLSPDEGYLATASSDGTVKIWDFAQGVCLDSLEYKYAIKFVAFHPERDILVLATDTTIIVWDWIMGKHPDALSFQPKAKAHLRADSSITALGFADNILVASEKQALHLWDIDSEKAVFSRTLLTPFQTLAVHPGRHLLAAAEANGTVWLWDLARKKDSPMAILPHPGAVQSLCFHPYKPYLATASQTGGIRFWQYSVSKELTMLDYPGTIEEMGFYQDKDLQKLIVTLKEPQAATEQIWTISPGDTLPSVSLKREKERMSIATNIAPSLFPTSTLKAAFSKERGSMAVRTSDWQITLYQFQGTNYVPQASYQHPCKLIAISLSPDGHAVAFTDETYACSLWDWRREQVQALPWKFTQCIHHLVFSDKNALLAVTENAMGIWDMREHKSRFLFKQNGPILGCEVHPAGHSFLTLSNDMFVRVWSCEKAEPLCVLAHLAPIQQARFSSTGKYILTISATFIVRVWDSATGHPLTELEHDDKICRLALSKDEQYLATASCNHYLRLWHWASDTLFEQARYHMRRNFTPEEWLLYFGDQPYEETFLLDWRADERSVDTW